MVWKQFCHEVQINSGCQIRNFHTTPCLRGIALSNFGLVCVTKPPRRKSMFVCSSTFQRPPTRSQHKMSNLVRTGTWAHGHMGPSICRKGTTVNGSILITTSTRHRTQVHPTLLLTSQKFNPSTPPKAKIEWAQYL